MSLKTKLEAELANAKYGSDARIIALGALATLEKLEEIKILLTNNRARQNLFMDSPIKPTIRGGCDD